MAFNRGTGYTITEVLIVLAISGAMFLSATIAFRGRQQQVQFDQSVRDFEAQLRDVMNDVVTGYYPSDTTVACDVGDSENAPPVITQTGTNPIGTNSECLYVGKALQFKSSDFAEPDRGSTYRIFNLAGKRTVSAKNLEIAESIAVVRPTAVEFTDTIKSIKYGIEISKIVEVVSPTVKKEHGIVAFLANFEGGNVANSITQAQNVRIAGINPAAASSSYNLNEADAVKLINKISEDSSVTEGYADFQSRNGVTFCLDDGDGRKASITIGNIGAESTLLKIGNVAEECA
jgi:type II secretory pathway pseudopilin PulG